MLGRFLFGDDIFISYSRKDGAKYAAALANELSKPGNNFSCFLDQWGASAANELSKPVLRAIKYSSVLVLIGTAGAAESALVRQEVESFSRKHWFRSRRPVLPINIDGALSTLSWSELTGLYRVPETNDARTEGIPSDSVIRLIANSDSYTKRAQRTRLLSLVALALLIASVGTSVFAAYKAKQATTESQRANTESARASKEALNAKSQEEIALKNKRDAELEAEKAKASAIVAQEQQKIASEKAEEARQQAEIAQEATRTARAQELSAHARAISPSDPGAGLLTALEAVQVKPIEEAQDALRATLVRLPEQEVLRGAKEEIRSAEFSADDRYVITTSFDGKARLYEVSTGALINSFEDQQAPILCAAFSPNGKYIVLSGMSVMMGGTRIGNDSGSSGDNPFTEVISLESKKTLHRLTDATGTTISFSADSRYVLLSAETIKKANMTMWLGSSSVMVELDTGKSIELPKETVVGPAVFTSDNRILAVGTPPNLRVPIIQMVNPVSRSVSSVSTVEGEQMNDVGIFAQPTKQQKVVVVKVDNELLLVDAVAGSVVARIAKPVNSVAFSPAGDLIAAGAGDGMIYLYKVPSGEMVGSFKSNSERVTSMSFSQDEQHLLIAGGDNVLGIWRIRSGNSDSKLAVGNVRSGGFDSEQVGELTGHRAEISSVRLSHGGDLILTGGVDGTSRIWRTSTYELKTYQLEKAGNRDLQDVTFSPLADRLVATESRIAYLWNLITGTHVELLSDARKTGSRRDYWIRKPIFSRDGKRILIQVEDEKKDIKFVELYDSDGSFLMSFPGELNEARSAAFSRDNNHLVLINEDAAVVWSIKEKRIVKKLGDASAKVVSVAFSPKGTSVATCARNGLVQLWSFPGWKPLSKIAIDSDELYQLGFSPNGNYLYVRDAYRRQWLWNTLNRRVIAFAKRDQTVMEWGFSDDSSLVFSHDLTDRTLVEQTKDGKTVSSVPIAILAIGVNNKFLIDSRLAFWETFRSKPFAKTIMPNDFWPIGVKLNRGELIAVSKDGRIMKRPLDEFGSLEEVISIATRRARATQ